MANRELSVKKQAQYHNSNAYDRKNIPFLLFSSFPVKFIAEPTTDTPNGMATANTFGIVFVILSSAPTWTATMPGRRSQRITPNPIATITKMMLIKFFFIFTPRTNSKIYRIDYITPMPQRIEWSSLSHPQSFFYYTTSNNRSQQWIVPRYLHFCGFFKRNDLFFLLRNAFSLFIAVQLILILDLNI